MTQTTPTDRYMSNRVVVNEALHAELDLKRRGEPYSEATIFIAEWFLRTVKPDNVVQFIERGQPDDSR